jgi:1,4-dihydroxy-2-naphthoyl-CoA hydrolase
VTEFIERITQRGRGTMQETVGVRILEVNDEHTLTAMDFRPEVQQLTGLFHTGALLTLADGTATIACLYAVDPTGAAEGVSFPLAVQLSANLIRNTGAGTVTAEARLAHRGRSTIVVETTVRDDQGRTLVLVTTTHLILAGTKG